MIFLYSYLLISITVFSVDRWVAKGDCPICKGECTELSLVSSFLVAFLWPAILVLAVVAAVRNK